VAKPLIKQVSPHFFPMILRQTFAFPVCWYTIVCHYNRNVWNNYRKIQFKYIINTRHTVCEHLIRREGLAKVTCSNGCQIAFAF
uniref:Uncharacterized protein n=1 Tax=Oryzias sinensis TaxID=183150 RepID=A0A8C7Y8H9_9TELE